MCRVCMASGTECVWLRRRVIHMLDAACLLSVLIVQGSIMNYYIISHYKSNLNTYFWFIGDFVCLFAFAGTLWISYKYCRRQMIDEGAAKELSFSPSRVSKNYPMPILGVLPLSYISWFFYSCLLLGKIILIFKSEIPDALSPEQMFGPQLLKISIALSAIIFLLLVEGHNYSDRESPRFIYITAVCGKTGIEIFDTVTLLSLLFVNETRLTLTFTLENTVITLACINFLLPTLALYKLSLSNFASQPFPLPLVVVYNFLHLCFIDIPYLWIRIYMWVEYHNPTSLFIMKNVLGIIYVVRGIYPDLYRLAKHVSKQKVMDKAGENVELQTVNSVDEKTHVQNCIIPNHKVNEFEDVKLNDAPQEVPKKEE